MKTVSALILGLAASSYALDRPLYGIDYDTRSNEWGGCKSDEEFLLDFKALNNITKHVRIYTTNDGCIDRILNIASVEKVKLWLGLWSNIEPEKDAFEPEFKTLQRLVKEHRVRNDNVLGIHVASEALFRYYTLGNDTWANTTGLDKIIGYLHKTRDFLRANDINIPVTIADVVDSYKAAPVLYDVVDVVSINQFSQWEGVHAADGVNILFERIKDVQIAAKRAGKIVLFSETGWSAAGNVTAIKEASPKSAARYLNDFMRFTEQQNIAYYYFTSFNLKWGESDFSVVERNFGLFDENRRILPHVQNVTLGKYHKPVRIWQRGQVLKADGANTNTFGRVFFEESATGLSDTMDSEIWFWDEDLLTFRSRSTNKCLDTYGDANGDSQLHLYWCDGNNINQKWRFRPDGTKEIVSKASLVYSDVTPDAALGNGTNPAVEDITVPVGAFIGSTRTARGRCLTRVGSELKMIKCNYDESNKFSVRPLDTEEIYLTAIDTTWRVTENYGRITVSSNPITESHLDSQIWFYDPLLQRIRNKANGRACLDLVEDKNEGLVQGRWCDHTPSQSWSYNDLSGQIQHLGKIGLCMYVDGEGKELRVQYCDVNSRVQKWAMDLVNKQ